MGRNINAKNIGIIIRALKEKDRYTKELVALGVPKEITIRILRDYLQPWGLIEENHERGKRWVWFEYAKKQPWKGTPLLFNVAKGHTHDLLPGLEALLDVNSTIFLKGRNSEKLIGPIPFDDDYEVNRRNKPFLSKFAEQHLKTGYPEIYDVLIEFRRLDSEIADKIEEAKERALTNFMKRFGNFKKKPDDVELLEGNQIKHVSELIKQKPELGKSWKKYTKNIPYFLGPFHSKQELAEVTEFLDGPFPTPILSTIYRPSGILKIFHYFGGKESDENTHCFFPGPVKIKISKGDETIMNEHKVFLKQKYGELAKQISMLKWQAQNQPLDGQCDICPNILIKEKDSG